MKKNNYKQYQTLEKVIQAEAKIKEKDYSCFKTALEAMVGMAHVEVEKLPKDIFPEDYKNIADDECIVFVKFSYYITTTVDENGNEIEFDEKGNGYIKDSK